MIEELIQVLKEMDSVQQETDEYGEREVAWYYYRETIEQVLGLPYGTLDSSR